MRIILAAILLAGMGFAQVADPVPTGPDDIPVYLPGGDEAGPTLPSRRGIGPVFANERLMRIRPYVGVNAIYDSGLTPIVTDEAGNLINRGAYGMTLNFGAVGSKAYRHSLLNLSYQGSLRHYPRSRFLTGTNHVAAIGFNHMFSRRLSLISNNSAGIRSNSFMGTFGRSLLDEVDDEVPVDDVFNNPVIYASTMQQLVYQKSARTSFSAGGGGFLQQRRSNALVSVRGGSVTGGAQYRLSARKTIGTTYGFNQFFFSGSYGGSNVHNLSVEYGHQIARRTEITLSAGGARVESQALRSVPLDPILAALLGRSTGVEATYRKNYLPLFGASLSHSRRASNFYVNANRSINPGNGLVLTSRRTIVGGGYSYTGIRRWTFRASAGYSEFQGLLGTARSFRSYRGSVGATFRLGHGLSWTTGVSARRMLVDEDFSGDARFLRTQYRVSTGIRWSPDGVPVPFF